MANTVPGRSFTGTNSITFNNTGLAQLTGAFTMAFVLRVNSVTGHLDVLGTDAGGWEVVYDDNAVRWVFYNDTQAQGDWGTLAPTINHTYLLAARKAAGSNNVTLTQIDFADGISHHVVGSQFPINNLTVFSPAKFGANTIDNLTGYTLYVAGFWNSQLSDAQVVDLYTTGTAVWSSAVAPKGLFFFDQASIATPLDDLSGVGTGQTAISGTTVDNTNLIDSRFARPPGVPGQVTGLTIIAKPGRAVLSWTAPANGGSAITDYLIERAPDVSGSPGTYATVTDGVSTAVTYTDTGLVNGSIYWYRVSAINAIGTGTASTAVSASPTAHPWVEASNSEVGTAIGTANAVALPAGAATGDLVLAFVANDLSATTTAITASAGWTSITNTNQIQGTSVVAMNVFARVLDGSGSDALAVSGSVSQDYVAQTYLIKAGDHGVTTINTDIVAAGTTGSSTNGNPPNDNPAVSKTWLWLTALTLDLTTGTTITGIPANYTLLLNQVSASSTSSVALATAYRRLTASAEDPGTFTNVSRAWCAVTIAIPPASVVTLTVNAATHGHTAANVVLTQVHNITVANATHAHTAGNVAISKNLVVANATHGHTAGAVVLVVSPAVQSATHGHTAQNVALSKNLVVASATHGHTAANVALGVPLTVASASHGHTAGAVTLVASPAVQNASHGHTATNVALIVNLAVANSSHGHTAQNVSLAAAANLVVANSTHGHTAQNVVLVVNLAVQGATHGHSAANVALGVSLTVQGATHAHAAGALSLVVNLAVASATHGHTAQNVVLVKNLVVQSATHSHVATNVAVGVPLIVASATHGHTVANVGLGVGGSVSSASHAVTSTNVALGIPLIVASATHGHAAGGVTLTLPVNLVVQSATHAHTATSVKLVVNLVVASATHGHTVTNVALAQPSGLVVQDATHSHTSSNVALTGVHILALQSGVHAHIASTVTLISVTLLVVAGARHTHLSPNITIVPGGTPLKNVFYLNLDNGDVYQQHTTGEWDLQGTLPDWVPVP